MYLITWSKRDRNFEISKNLGICGWKFGINDTYCHNFDLTMNFIRVWPWKNSSLVSHCVLHAHIRGPQLLDQSRANTNIMGANDWAISLNYYIIVSLKHCESNLCGLKSWLIYSTICGPSECTVWKFLENRQNLV